MGRANALIELAKFYELDLDDFSSVYISDGEIVLSGIYDVGLAMRISSMFGDHVMLRDGTTMSWCNGNILIFLKK